MSQKSGKKLRKRLDDETETCAKIPIIEINNKPLEESNVENGIVEESNINVQENMGEVELNGTNDESKNCVESKEQNSEVVTHEKKTEITAAVEEIETKSECTFETKISNATETNQKKCPEIQEEGLETQCNKVESKVETENELEPLVLETEDVDPELEFDENSDIDSQKSSPLRCATRRSQTRNIPTPKTPKIFDSISEDKISEYSEKPSVVTVPTPEITDTESEVSVFKPVTDIYDTNEELTTKTNENFDSLPNISTKAVAGSDTTRNIELSSYVDGELSPFLVHSREKSVAETMKLLTSRRSIRTTRDYTLSSSSKKEYKTYVYPREESNQNLGSMKRKTRNDSPDFSKRFKSESPGLLSYFSSPITNIKNRFTNKSEIPSSTPKLTGYKSKYVFDNTNMSKISLNETDNVTEKKWCTIM